MSYPLTAFHGVPHGHAVALTLGGLLVHNRGVTVESCWDPRGPGHVRTVLDAIIALLGAADAEGARRTLDTLMRDMGLGTRLSLFGVKAPADVRFLMSNGINPQRLRNNPRALSDADIEAILTSVL
jgi:phosphonoacetaldehyde reductase